jgi:fructokinase
VIGGGVMSKAHLFPLVRQQVVELLNNYVRAPEILDAIDTFIVPPGLGQQSGILGALALAEREHQQTRTAGASTKSTFFG